MDPIRKRVRSKQLAQRVATVKPVIVKPSAAAKPAAKPDVGQSAPKGGKRAGAEPQVQAPHPSNSRRKWYIALGIVGLAVLAASTALAITGKLAEEELRFFWWVNHAWLPDWVAEQVAKPVSNAVWGMVFLVAALLAVPKYRLLAWQYAVAAGSTYVAVYILEHVVGRARPVALEGYDAIMRGAQGGYGFPSGHVAVLTALVLTAWPFIAWPWRIVLLLFVGVEAWSRVYLGVHAPLDVVGGVAVAASVVAVLHLLPGKFRNILKLSA